MWASTILPAEIGSIAGGEEALIWLLADTDYLKYFADDRMEYATCARFLYGVRMAEYALASTKHELHAHPTLDNSA